MRYFNLAVVIAILFMFVPSVTVHSAGSLSWTKPRTKLLAWPGKGKANRLPAYSHLSSPVEEFINFSYCPQIKYCLKDGGIEINFGDKKQLIKSDEKLALPLDIPGSARKISFEIFPPDDPEHYGEDIDKLQWKIRNPNALSFSINGAEFIFLDADANGVFFDLGVDLCANLESSKFVKGEFDPAVVKWTPFTGVFTINKVLYLVSIDSKSNAYYCEFAAPLDSNYAQGFALLNDVRAQHGYDPVLPDIDLSDLLAKHSAYCANVAVTREEDPKSYYSDSAAAKVARYSFTTRAASVLVGMKSALCTLFARNMLLHPGTKAFGAALFDNMFTVGGVKAAWEADFQNFYPFPGQRRVLQRYVLEDPPALRTGEESFSGTFIVLGGLKPNVTVSEAVVEDIRNGPLKVSVSTPNDPPNEKVKAIWPDNRKGITIISNEPLKSSTIYHVKVSLKEKPEDPDKIVEWLFMTEIPPQR